MISSIVTIVLVLLASAFFSGLEFAFISANKLRVELQKQKGGLISDAIEQFYDRPTQFIGTTLLGNNIALVVYGILFSKLLEPHFTALTGSEFAGMLIQTLISTIIILFVGEFIPKSLFSINPTGILRFAALPFLGFYYLFYVVVTVIVGIARLLLKVFFGLTYEEESNSFGRMDLQSYIQMGNNNESPTEDPGIDTDLFEKALHLPQIKVRECMIPRLEVEAVDERDSLETKKQKFIATKHSKLLVYRETIDNIIGYIHHQDILRSDPQIRDALKVPEAMAAAELLDSFIKTRKGIAWVIDEFGGTAGIVTLEDIMEEIFGEIHDEFDDEQLHEVQIDEYEYGFAARLEIDYVNEKYDLNIEEGDYETLGGYILYHKSRIPKAGEIFEIDRFSIEIVEATRSRIERIKLRVMQDEE